MKKDITYQASEWVSESKLARSTRRAKKTEEIKMLELFTNVHHKKKALAYVKICNSQAKHQSENLVYFLFHGVRVCVRGCVEKLISSVVQVDWLNNCM